MPPPCTAVGTSEYSGRGFCITPRALLEYTHCTCYRDLCSRPRPVTAGWVLQEQPPAWLTPTPTTTRQATSFPPVMYVSDATLTTATKVMLESIRSCSRHPPSSSEHLGLVPHPSRLCFLSIIPFLLQTHGPGQSQVHNIQQRQRRSSTHLIYSTWPAFVLHVIRYTSAGAQQS